MLRRVKPRGVLFDLDGTLVDHDGAVDAALRGWLPAAPAPPERLPAGRGAPAVLLDRDGTGPAGEPYRISSLGELTPAATGSGPGGSRDAR